MVLQSPARRLLTEATAALAYLPLSARAAANGVASLGADGKVPAAQLPTASAPPKFIRPTASLTPTPTVTDVPGFAVALDAVGLWEIDVYTYVTPTANQNLNHGLVPTGGLAIDPARSNFLATWHSTSTTAQTVTANYPVAWTAGTGTNSGNPTPAATSSGGTQPGYGVWKVLAQVTTVGTLKVVATGTGSTIVGASCFLKATKIA
jgi:hypothetical protein